MSNHTFEIFTKPYYFLIESGKEYDTLHFSVGNDVSKVKEKKSSIKFPKSKSKDIKEKIKKITNDKKISTKQGIKQEMEEFIDQDGTMSTSSTPIINKSLSPRKTMDQTVVAARDTVNPVVRGYRRYYGESRMFETDMSDAFGYEETKDMNGKETYKYFVEKLGLEPDEAKERTRQQGKDPYGKRTQNAPKKIRNQKGFIDRMTLSEVEKVVEDLVLKNKKDNKDISQKDKKTISKIIEKNIGALLKMADMDGISTEQLIKMIKNYES